MVLGELMGYAFKFIIITMSTILLTKHFIYLYLEKTLWPYQSLTLFLKTKAVLSRMCYYESRTYL